MACNIIEDYLLDCADSVAGVKKVYWTEFANVTSVTSSSGTVTAITKSSGKKFWVIELEDENAEFKVSHKRNVENGTLHYEATLSFTMKKMSAKNRNNIRLAIQNKLMVIVEDNNGKYWLVGETRSMRITGVEAQSGKKFDDLNGYTVTLMAKEINDVQEVSSGIISGLLS
jgi:hypothetical protein